MGVELKQDSQAAWPRGTPDRTISLQGGLEAPAAARRVVGDWIGETLSTSSRDDALMLVSELVSNAVRHGGAGPIERIEVHFAVDSGGATFEVCDVGPGFMPPVSPVACPEGGGFGLVLIESMSRSWGAHLHAGAGTCVWFDLDSSPG